MELGEWIGGWIIENSDNRGSDNRGFTVIYTETIIYLSIVSKPEILDVLLYMV